MRVDENPELAIGFPRSADEGERVVFVGVTATFPNDLDTWLKDNKIAKITLSGANEDNEDNEDNRITITVPSRILPDLRRLLRGGPDQAPNQPPYLLKAILPGLEVIPGEQMNDLDRMRRRIALSDRILGTTPAALASKGW